MKKNIFKKLGGLFLGLAMGLGVAVGVTAGHEVKEAKADSVSDFVSLAKGKGTSGSGSAFTVTSAGISFDFDLAYGSAGTQIRSYAGGSCVVSYGTNITVSNIVFTWGDGKNGGTWTGGTLKDSNITWSSVTSGSSIKNSAQARITEISVTYTSSGTPTTNYTVTFDVQGHGTAPQAATVASGGKVTRPTDPSASGYTFGGWYKETGCTTAYDFNTAVTSSFTLYAKWTEESGGGGETSSKITKLADIVSGKQYWIGATVGSADSYFTADVSAASNSVSGTSSENTNGATIVTITEVTGGYTLGVGVNLYLSLSTAKANGKVIVTDTAAIWTLKEEGDLISMKINDHYLMKNTSGSTNFGSYGSGQANVWLLRAPDAVVKSLVSISTLSADVSAMSSDTSWTIANLSVTGVLSDSASVVDVAEYVNVSVTQSVPTIEDDGTMNVTLVAKGKDDQSISKSVNVTASLTLYNALRAIYSMANNDAVDVYGLFVGNKDGNNIIVMDGVYGMDVYKSGCGTNNYVANETVLHIVGKVSIFNGLYEIAATSVSIDTSHTVGAPVIYAVKGGETQDFASRLTTVTGVPSVTKGSITGSAGSADITLSFAVSKTASVQVFYKKATQTSADMATIKEFIDAGTEMTVAGFTAWYNGFQVQMTGIIEADETYTAEVFAQDLLDQTDAICASYDGVANNETALIAVWNDLQGNEKYPALPSAEKQKLLNASANESGTVVEKAMARYDFVCGKYQLSNFINRSVPAGSPLILPNTNTNSDTAMMIIIVTSIVSIGALGVLITIKKRKSLAK